MSIARRCIERPVAVVMLFLAVSMLGLISFARLPIDLLPDVSYPRLVVYTTYPDVGPAEVERFVTEVVERAVARAPGVERVESVSREGVSLVTLRFAWGTDMDFAVLNVREQLDNLRDDLPDLSSRPAVLRTDPNAEPIMAVSVAGRGDLAALKDLAESVFKRRLEQIDGVAEAALVGGLAREIHVEVDPRLLESYGFTIDDIRAALDAANQSAPGGTIRRGRYRYALRTLGEFQTVDEIADVPLQRDPVAGASADNVVLLGDVATVEDGFRDRESIARYNGAEAVGLLLFKESGSNTVRVADRVSSVLDELRQEYADIELDVAMSQAGFIRDAISNVVQALVVGGILAFLVLFLFLRDARYPVAVALAIPISVVASFALLDLAGVSLNIMSLGGLALGVGMLVDNSIVVLENIFRHRQHGTPGAEAAALGAAEVQGAITASTLTTISVFGPIIYVQGVAGQLFAALSFAVAFALVTSLVVALTLLPMMAARVGTAGDAETASGVRKVGRRFTHWVSAGVGAVLNPVFGLFDRGFGRLANWYHEMLERALDHRAGVVGIAVLTMVVGIGLATLLDRDVLPDVDQGGFRARLVLPRGMALEETAAAAAQLETAIRRDPAVDAVFTRVGRQDAVGGVEDEERGLHTAVLDVRMRGDETTEGALQRLQPVFSQFPPGTLQLETGSATALGRLLGGSDADLAVRVRGDDLDEAWSHARGVEERLQPLRSLHNVRVGIEEGQPEIVIEIDRERAAAYGIEPRLVAQTVEDYMRGSLATDFVDFDEKVPVLVRLPEVQRRSLQTLGALQVNGIPMRELVSTRETVSPAEIRRVEQARSVAVLADVASGGLDAAVADVRQALAAFPPPHGLRVDITGENEERARSFRNLAFAFGLALILVYMILAAQFESFVLPFTILLSVPLATVGASAALWIAGEGLNSMSLIGVVILVGIVVNDAIIKVDFINQMRAQGRRLREAILDAGRVRLRPIVMTTVTTVLGLTPMALGLGRGADLRAPLAIAVIGGLISATVLTLVVVPVAYDLLDELRQWLRASLGMRQIAQASEAGVASSPIRSGPGTAGP